MPRLSDERARQICAEALRLVLELGYDHVTMDRIAEATQSSKATLYRVWGGKATLLVDALDCVAFGVNDPERVVPDTGELRGDLLALLAPRENVRGDEGALIAAVLQAMKTDQELAAAVRERLIGGLNEQTSVVIERAVARGEIAPVGDLTSIHLAIAAPFVLFEPFHGRRPGNDDTLSYLDAVVLPALGVR